jgi:hypothetical protein
MNLLRLPHQLTILPLPGQLNARVPTLVTGGSVNLYYSPETWWSWATQQKVGGVSMDPNHRVNSDDVLLHELVHALRMMLNKPFLGALSNLKLDRFHYDDGRGNYGYEEFYAILVTNIYLSAAGRSNALRDDHAAVFHPLGSQDATLKNPLTFAQTFHDELEYFHDDMRDFFLDLSRVNCLFNPLRFWFQVHAKEEARRRMFAEAAPPKKQTRLA